MKLKIKNKTIILQENYGVFKTFVGDTYEAIGKFLKDSGKVLGNFTMLGFNLTSNITQGILGLKSMKEMSVSIKKSTENFDKKVSVNLKSIDDTTKMMLRDAGVSEAEAIALMNLSLPGFFLSEILNSKSEKSSSVSDIIDKTKEIEIKNGYDRFIYLVFYENFTGLNPKTASIDNSCLEYIRTWIKNDLSFGKNAIRFFEEICKLNKFHTNVKTLYTSTRAYIDMKDNVKNIDSKLSQSRKNFDNFFKSYERKIKENGDINNEYIGNIKTILIIVASIILAESGEDIREKYFKMTLPGSEEVKQEIEEVNKDLEGVKTILVHCSSIVFSINRLIEEKFKKKGDVSSENFTGNNSLTSIYKIKLNELSGNLKNKDIIGKLLKALEEDLKSFESSFIEIENNIDNNLQESEKQSILKTSFLEFLSKLFEQSKNQIAEISNINKDIVSLNESIEEKTKLIKDKIVNDAYRQVKNNINFLQNQISGLESTSRRVDNDIKEITTKLKINAEKVGLVDSSEDEKADEDLGDNTLQIQNFNIEVN